MRLVLDTNVVVSALLWHGRPGTLLNTLPAKDATFFTSSPLLEELADVLSRLKLQAQIAAAQLSVLELIGIYSASAIKVNPVSVPRTAPDPDDDVVIGTALAAQADFIVTGDRTLLAVARYESVRIIAVAEALQMLKQSWPQ
jgi:hypothetical protein